MLGACGDWGPAVSPDPGIAPAAAPTARPVPVPDDGPLSLAHSPAAAVDDVVMSTCGPIEIEASRPERIRDEQCREEYLVNLSVATASPHAAILDMFRSYDVADWRVETGSRRVRHELSLVWRPYRDARTSDAIYRAGRITKPLTIRVCPEGPGAVLACSGTACDLYEDEGEVPSVYLPTQDAVVETPWGYDDIQDLREGSSLLVRVRYFVRSRAAVLTLNMLRWQRRSSREVRVVPRSRKIRNSQGFGTTTFRISATRDGLAQDPSVEEFWVLPSYDGPRAGCVVASPRRFQVRIRNR